MVCGKNKNKIPGYNLIAAIIQNIAKANFPANK